MATAFTTGTTSDIGKASAYLFVQNKFNLILRGLAYKETEKLKIALPKLIHVHSLPVSEILFLY